MKQCVRICIVAALAASSACAKRPSYAILGSAYFPGVAATNIVQGMAVNLDELTAFGLDKTQVVAAVGTPDTNSQFLFLTINSTLENIDVPTGGGICIGVLKKTASPGTSIALVSGPRRPIKVVLER